MEIDYPAKYEHLHKLSAELTKELGGTMSAFAQLNAKSCATGALDTKTKQLIALGIGITAHCEGCIVYHVKHALRSGSTREEILETIGVAIMMGGGPAMIYAGQALESLNQFTAA